MTVASGEVEGRNRGMRVRGQFWCHDVRQLSMRKNRLNGLATVGAAMKINAISPFSYDRQTDRLSHPTSPPPPYRTEAAIIRAWIYFNHTISSDSSDLHPSGYTRVLNKHEARAYRCWDVWFLIMVKDRGGESSDMGLDIAVG
ncbi:hypothetical protein M409DRAFT_60290 [Zasmidium cellare ATCC 36951]|uniref:Uncharacterized protein n=1 Tax=Zasmidium cellare ATCC 36951 TaxID=1080233 RepID=A0A6A6BYZ9_ZASCE|nr:uncharacterized protein M409DRAFT_60290 [Zasmidium cellare ATCC 36951]KAF2160027.1 hypothetical protein M409DRAFT_60290 [Zasmidium cellare ATCC 36951]